MKQGLNLIHESDKAWKTPWEKCDTSLGWRLLVAHKWHLGSGRWWEQGLCPTASCICSYSGWAKLSCMHKWSTVLCSKHFFIRKILMSSSPASVTLERAEMEAWKALNKYSSNHIPTGIVPLMSQIQSRWQSDRHFPKILWAGHHCLVHSNAWKHKWLHLTLLPLNYL